MKEQTNSDYYSKAEVLVFIHSFLGFALKRWWLFLVSIGLCVGLATYYYYQQKPKYQAQTTFILEERSAGGGGLAGLASQFGFSMGSLGGGSMFSGDNVLSILTSKKVLQQVLLSSINPQNDTTLADLYLDFAGFKASWAKKPPKIPVAPFFQSASLSPQQDSVLNDIYTSLTKKNISIEKTSKQGTIFKVSVTAPNSLFARLVSERIAEQASKLYLEVKTSDALANIGQLQRRSDSLLSLLNRKSYTAAASQPLDYNPGIKSAIVPVEIATRDKAVIGTMYAEVAKSLEMSKLLLAQQTPVIQILDRPTLLLGDNKKGLFILSVVGAFAGALLAFAGVLLFFWLRPTK